jgi:uncharacterized protein
MMETGLNGSGAAQSRSAQVQPARGRVVVTGATGLVGRPLVAALLREGYSVTALVRHPEVARGRLPAEVTLSAWRGDAVPDVGVFTGVSAASGAGAGETLAGVVHLAGESIGKWPWSRARKKLLWHSRVTATQYLVQAMRAASVPPPVLVTASGMGYHGDAGIAPVTEDGAAGRGFLGELAAAWEAAASEGAGVREAGAAEVGAGEGDATRVVMLRFGMILAREGGALPALRRPFALGLGARLGSGRQGHPWIHLDDAVGLILHALRGGGDAAFKPLHGPVHACVAPVPSQAEFARALGRALHRPVWAWAPAFALRAALGEFSSLLLDGQYTASIKASQAGYRWHYPDLDAALRAIVSPS